MISIMFMEEIFSLRKRVQQELGKGRTTNIQLGVSRGGTFMFLGPWTLVMDFIVQTI